MPRIARMKFDSLTYHIISRGNNKMSIFLDETDYQQYLEILNKYKKKYIFYLYNFVLMPNHVHLLLKADTDLSRLMHGINLSYAQYFKKRYSHVGHFWQDRFKSYIVEDDTYLLTVARYIERNPLKANLIKNLREYEYSSYNFYAYGENCGIEITTNPLYFTLSNDTTKLKKVYQNLISEQELDSIPNGLPMDLNIIKAQFISSDKFAQQLIESRFTKRIRRRLGRPRKNRENFIPNLL